MCKGLRKDAQLAIRHKSARASGGRLTRADHNDKD